MPDHSYHPPRRGEAIDWLPPSRSALEREIAPGLTLREFMALASELDRERATLDALPLPGEPTAYRVPGTGDPVTWLPYDWPWLRMDELWQVLHRFGPRSASVKVATLDRDKAARAGL